MKKLAIALLFLVFASYCIAQDSTQKWKPSVGINFTSVPTTHISGTDTSFQNALSVGPFFSIRSHGGFGVVYSPVFVAGGSKSGIFMHIITIGLEQYDRENFDLVAEYSHFFFTNNKSIPWSPISNEVILAATYKKFWIRPKISAGFGFGTNNEVSPSTQAYDIELAAGISHSFEWELNHLNFNVTPSVLVNAGTNEYFSFLSLNRYISHSKKFSKYIKNPRGKSGGGNSLPQIISVNNLELNLESSLDKGSFSIRPAASLFVPISSTSNSGLDGYWELALTYNF
jgi:hypothetical protein